MANRTVLTWPNPRLNKKSELVDSFDDDLASLVTDIIDTMNVNMGVGLAAPQINVHKRVVVINCSDCDVENPDPFHENEKMLVLINPDLELSGDDIRWEEACLSLPGYSAHVTRKEKAYMTYQDINGEYKDLSVEWPLSGVIQHEVDHLDGRLYLNSTSHWERQRIQKKILKLKKRQAKVAAEMRRRERLMLKGIDPDDPRRQTHGPGKKKKKRVKVKKTHGKKRKKK
jgi:peptide deformylase